MATASFQLEPVQEVPGFRPKALSRRKPDRDGFQAEDVSASGIRIMATLSEGRGTLRVVNGAGRELDRDGAIIDLDQIEVASPPRQFESTADPTCYVTYVRPVVESGSDRTLDSQLLERLEALGYTE